jgi:death-on-curing protein
LSIFDNVEGVKDLGLLETALYRPQTGHYTDLIEQAAALWESLSQIHPFVDGKKHTTFAGSYRIHQLISGKRAMTADTALRLEQWLGVEAAFWMNLQNSYELDLATEKFGEKIKRTVQRRSSPSSVQAVELRQRGAFPAPDSATVTAVA